MRPVFITGTGTGIGKTFITCALAHQFGKLNKVTVAKPIITGWSDNMSDTHLLLAANDQEISRYNIESCSPWRLG